MQNLPIPSSQEAKSGTTPDSQHPGLDIGKLDVALCGSLLGTHYFRLDSRKSITAIAKELGVDETTVRTRLKRWKDSGFLVKWGATVNQSLLGQHGCLLRLEVPEPSLKEEVVEKVKLIDGVYRVRDYFGGALSVSMFYDDMETLESRIKLLSTLSGSDRIIRADIVIQHSAHKPDMKDLLIIGSIGWSSRKTYSGIAKETGMSVKTVRNRLETMIEDNMIGMGLFLDYRNLVGVVVADLLVFYNDYLPRSNADQRILTIVRGRLLPPYGALSRGAGFFRILLTNVSQQREILARILKVEGVDAAYLDVLVEDIYVAEAFYKLERKMLRDVTYGKVLPAHLRELWERGWRLSTREIYPRRTIK